MLLLAKVKKKSRLLTFFFLFLAGKFSYISGGSVSVTAVDSGWRALEFLGLDNEKASVEFDVSHGI